MSRPRKTRRTPLEDSRARSRERVHVTRLALAEARREHDAAKKRWKRVRKAFGCWSKKRREALREKIRAYRQRIREAVNRRVAEWRAAKKAELARRLDELRKRWQNPADYARAEKRERAEHWRRVAREEKEHRRSGSQENELHHSIPPEDQWIVEKWGDVIRREWREKLRKGKRLSLYEAALHWMHEHPEEIAAHVHETAREYADEDELRGWAEEVSRRTGWDVADIVRGRYTAADVERWEAEHERREAEHLRAVEAHAAHALAEKWEEKIRSVARASGRAKTPRAWRAVARGVETLKARVRAAGAFVNAEDLRSRVLARLDGLEGHARDELARHARGRTERAKERLGRMRATRTMRAERESERRRIAEEMEKNSARRMRGREFPPVPQDVVVDDEWRRLWAKSFQTDWERSHLAVTERAFGAVLGWTELRREFTRPRAKWTGAKYANACNRLDAFRPELHAARWIVEEHPGGGGGWRALRFETGAALEELDELRAELGEEWGRRFPPKASKASRKKASKSDPGVPF